MTTNSSLPHLFLFSTMLISLLAVSAHHDTSTENIISSDQAADIIYFNGTVITLDKKSTIAEAVAIKDLNILDVGLDLDILKYVGGNTKVIDLNGKTMLPGFYDAHSHFLLNSLQKNQGFDLSPPPIGNVRKIADILTNIKNYILSSKMKPNQTILGLGYSDIALQQNRHPTMEQLDSISTEHPIMLLHSSMHLMVANSLAFKMCNVAIDSLLQDEKKLFQDKYNKFTGLIKENGIRKMITLIRPILLNSDIIEKGFADYYQTGYTTVHDILLSFTMGYIFKNSLVDFRNLTSHYFPLDIDAYLLVNSVESEQDWLQVLQTKKDNFKIKGLKIILDGSIQGRTAFFNQPYYTQNENIKSQQNGASYKWAVDRNQSCKIPICGIQSFPNQTLVNLIVSTAYSHSMDLLAHCNGDAAADQLILAVKQAKKIHPNVQNMPRIVMIHAQTVTEEQLLQMKQLQITPSFFPGHTYYWGNDHRKTFLGPIKAARIDPAHSAVVNNITFTLHNDASVTPIKPYGAFEVVWAAVNRLMLVNGELSDQVLGKEQRISVQDALRAVTINAAWQAREEQKKGSIQIGKQADLIVVSANPLKFDPLLLRNIKVLQTIKEGYVLYTDSSLTSDLKAIKEQKHESAEESNQQFRLRRL